MKLIGLILLFTLSLNVFAECDHPVRCLETVQQKVKNPGPQKNCQTKDREDDKSHNNLLILGATGLSLYPAFYLGIFLHEGSHALVAAGRGQKILDFTPYPHSMNGKSYFGRVRIGYDARSGTVERSRDDAWIASAPMILNTSLISGFTALKLSGNLPKNVWARLGLTVLNTTQALDMLNHARLGIADGDSFKLSYSLAHLTNSRVRNVHTTLNVGQYLVGGVGLVMSAHEFYKILKAGKAKLPELTDDSWSEGGEVYVAPMMFGGAPGIGVGGSF